MLEREDAQGRVSVTIRFDDAEAEDVVGVEDNGFLFFGTDDAERFAQATYESERVVLRFPPFNRTWVTSTFDTSHFAHVAAPYADVCGFE